MIRRLIFLGLVNLSLALFENCDLTVELDTDANITIRSNNTLNIHNTSSCRYTIIAPVNYIVEVTCLLRIDQPDSQKCPLRRFFVSADGINDLRGADYFCNRDESTRTVRRRSVMNRLVMAYASQTDVGDESYTCVAKRLASPCDCGWSKRVSFTLVLLPKNYLLNYFMRIITFRLEFITVRTRRCTNFLQCWLSLLYQSIACFAGA